jgi:hypothetical protein
LARSGSTSHFTLPLTPRFSGVALLGEASETVSTVSLFAGPVSKQLKPLSCFPSSKLTLLKHALT